MKKYKSIIVLLATTGCNFKNENSSQVISNGKAINTSSMKHKHCTRQGKVEGGSANLSYELFYTGENLNILKSEEQIISSYRQAKLMTSYYTSTSDKSHNKPSN